MTPLLAHSTPAADGFHMPAEFEGHDRCYLVWPERTDTWRLGAKPAQVAFAAVAEAVGASEETTVLASPRQWSNARASLPPTVRVVEMTSDDAWVRDTGPTFVVNRSTGERRGVDWPFNGWGGLLGGLLFPWDQDDLVAAKVCELEGVTRYRAPLVLEGGSIHVDGEGTCLTTEECLLNVNRNPTLSKSEVERHLRDYLGVDRVIWIPRGVPGDETDGHVDNLVCFTRPGRVLLTWSEDRADSLHGVSVEARRVLESATDARGRSLDVGLLPAPAPLTMTVEEAGGIDHSATAKSRSGGDRLAASYVNFFIGSSAIVFPLLDRRLDDEVAATLAAEFPTRTVTGLGTWEILLGGGNFHCITQQVPSILPTR